MDILRRSMAPISDEAWKEIDDLARTRMTGNLSARKLVAMNGPHGWELGAIDLGRLRIQEDDPIEGLHWGLRDTQPLIEVRLPFALSQMELDCINRGSKDPDLQSLETAAVKAATFEESCIYFGFERGGIKGMRQESPHEPIALPKEAAALPEVIAEGLTAVKQAGIGGPFALVVGTDLYNLILSGDHRGYPLSKRIDEILGDGIHWSPAFEQGGILISTREENFELTIGQDFSIGYHAHDRNSVELFITESFTFRVLEPRAAVEMRI